jgi:hypothetical protein
VHASGGIWRSKCNFVVLVLFILGAGFPYVPDYRPLLRLLVVEPATEDLFRLQRRRYRKAATGSFHAVVRRRSSLGPNSSLLEKWLTLEERHLFREQQLSLGPHPSPLARSHQLSDLTRSPIWCDLCLPSDVHAAKGSRKSKCKHTEHHIK